MTTEEITAVCPQFRILVVGNSGVGKSSLIKCVFGGTNPKDIDIAHNCAGKADVEVPYTSTKNPPLVLHDSEGFEPGNASNWETVEKFLVSRNENGEFKDRVHAIWLCIETPRTGARTDHIGNENLLILAQKLSIPTVVVFTKFDLLENEHFIRAQKPGSRKPLIRDTPHESAEEDYRNRIKSVYSQKQVQCVRISTKLGHPGVFYELIESTPRYLRGDKGEGWVPWVVEPRAQQ